MEYVILGLLILHPNTLYGIKKAFEQGISMFYSSSLGSLQIAVKRLEDKGFIRSEDAHENGRAKKVLTVTDEGQHAFFEWMQQPLEVKNLEVSFLSRLYFLGLLPTKADQHARLLTMRDTIKAAHQSLKEVDHSLENLELPDAYQPIFFYQKKVLHYGIDTHEYAITWVERLLKDIEGDAE